MGTLKLYRPLHRQWPRLSFRASFAAGSAPAQPTLANGVVGSVEDCVPNYRRSVSSLDPSSLRISTRWRSLFSKVDTYLGSLNCNPPTR